MKTNIKCENCRQTIEVDAILLPQADKLFCCPRCGGHTRILMPRAEKHRSSSSQPEARSSKAVKYADALRWLAKGAVLGDAESMAHWGIACLNGTGVPVDYAKAIHWLRSAAEQGDATGQTNLGLCFMHGEGVACDIVEAEKWIRKASEQGDAIAQFNLGNLYQFGRGVTQDFAIAFNWWLKAAQQGHAEAQYSVGSALERGDATGRDVVEAHKWLSLAAARGANGATQAANALAAAMTREQREESRKRQLAYRPPALKAEHLRVSDLITRVDKLQSASAAEGGLEEGGNLGDVSRRPIPADVRREVWRRDEGRCSRCGSRERLEYDHIIPVARGGSNTVRNIELLCETCNRTKSASIG